jgi:hypothetical protein
MACEPHATIMKAQETMVERGVGVANRSARNPAGRLGWLAALLLPLSVAVAAACGGGDEGARAEGAGSPVAETGDSAARAGGGSGGAAGAGGAVAATAENPWPATGPTASLPPN